MTPDPPSPKREVLPEPEVEDDGAEELARKRRALERKRKGRRSLVVNPDPATSTRGGTGLAIANE